MLRLVMALVILAGGLRAAPAKDSVQALSFTASDGVKLSALWYRSGKPRLIVVQPGFSQYAASRSMRFFASLLTPTADVLMVDSRGTGASEGNYHFGAREHLDIVAAVGAVPLAGYRQWDLMGLSLGAYASVRACTEGGLKPAHLLLLSCPTSIEGISFSGALLLNPLAMPFQRKNLAISPQNNVFFRWGPIFESKPSAAALAPRLASPVYFLNGKRDLLVFNSLSQAVYDAAPQPKTWTLWPDGLHAELMALQHPAQFQAWVADCLNPKKDPHAAP
jgi:pimeloyl-ACP methyl ester carboxylesterase